MANRDSFPQHYRSLLFEDYEAMVDIVCINVQKLGQKWKDKMINDFWSKICHR